MKFIELQVTYVNSIHIHDLCKYEQSLKHSNQHFINNFLIRVVENGFCLFCNSHKRNKNKMKIEKAQKE